MSCQDEVIKIVKKLDKMISAKNCDDTIALELLNTLKKLSMTLEVLQKTRVGMTVNTLRKLSTNDDVITLSKTLIKCWKKLLSGDCSGSQSSGSKVGQGASVSRSSSMSNVKDDDSGDSQQNDATSQKSDESRGSDSPHPTPPCSRASDTNDPIRLKSRELLTTALKTPCDIEGDYDYDGIAATTEDCIFQEFHNTDTKYKNRIRSRIANLKDAKNPRLRENVLLGHVTAARLAAMTPEEMASDEMKQLRAKLTKEAIDDHQMATNAGTKSDLFKCGKCGKRDTMYTQLQTRSSDEPMTTFVVCNVCGNRWKFC